jgi:hypothetical protein
MKRALWVFLSGMAVVLTGCTIAAPDAGHEAVIVRKPWFFGHGGVSADPVGTGRSYYALSTDAIDVNMLPQRVDMEFDDMMTKSGVPVSFHVVGTFRITDAVKLVSQFGADQTADKDGNVAWGFWTRNLDQPIRTAVRDSVKKRDMQEMAIDQSAADAVGQEVSEAANKIVTQSGVPIVFTAMNVGRVNPPDAIKNQRVETAAQEQRVITEQQTKLAEDARKAAEQSRAGADNAYREQMGLSPEQFIQLQNIKMEQAVCGNGGCTMILGGATALINLEKK